MPRSSGDRASSRISGSSLTLFQRSSHPARTRYSRICSSWNGNIRIAPLSCSCVSRFSYSASRQHTTKCDGRWSRRNRLMERTHGSWRVAGSSSRPSSSGIRLSSRHLAPYSLRIPYFRWTSSTSQSATGLSPLQEERLRRTGIDSPRSRSARTTNSWASCTSATVFPAPGKPRIRSLPAMAGLSNTSRIPAAEGGGRRGGGSFTSASQECSTWCICISLTIATAAPACSDCARRFTASFFTSSKTSRRFRSSRWVRCTGGGGTMIGNGGALSWPDSSGFPRVDSRRARASSSSAVSVITPESLTSR